MSDCIKYLKRKEIEVSSEKADHIYVFLLLTFNLLKSGVRSYFFFGRRADLRAILKSIFLSFSLEIFILRLEACTGIMWLGYVGHTE